MHGIGGNLVQVDTRLLIKLLKQESDVCVNTVNEEVMDVEKHYGFSQECLLTLESNQCTLTFKKCENLKQRKEFIGILIGNIVRMKCLNC